MSTVKVIKVNENVFAANDREADDIREMCKRNKTFFVNVMSAPGSGKTTMLVSLINMLKDKYNILEMDVDIDTDLDARRRRRQVFRPFRFTMVVCAILMRI